MSKNKKIRKLFTHQESKDGAFYFIICLIPIEVFFNFNRPELSHQKMTKKGAHNSHKVKP